MNILQNSPRRRCGVFLSLGQLVLQIVIVQIQSLANQLRRQLLPQKGSGIQQRGDLRLLLLGLGEVDLGVLLSVGDDLPGEVKVNVLLLIVRTNGVVDFLQHQLQQLAHELQQERQQAVTLQVQIGVSGLDGNGDRGAGVLQGLRVHALPETENVLFVHFHFGLPGLHGDIHSLDINTAVFIHANVLLGLDVQHQFI